jgi:hypothetical protein
MRCSIATPPTTLPDLKSIRSTLHSQLATLRPMQGVVYFCAGKNQEVGYDYYNHSHAAALNLY